VTFYINLILNNVLRVSSACALNIKENPYSTFTTNWKFIIKKKQTKYI